MAVGVLLDNSGRSASAVVQPRRYPRTNLRRIRPYCRDRARHKEFREDQVAIGAALHPVRLADLIIDYGDGVSRHNLVGTRITGALSGEEIHEMGTPSVVVHRAFSAGRINAHLAADSAGAKHLRGHEIDAFSRIVLGLQEGLVLPVYNAKIRRAAPSGGGECCE